MGRIHHLEVHAQVLQEFIEEQFLRAFAKHKLYEILEPVLPQLKLPGDKRAKYIIDFLLRKGWLNSRTFLSVDYPKREVYSWKTEDDFTVVSGLKSGTYHAYYSALSCPEIGLHKM